MRCAEYWAKSSISEQFPSGWLYLQGLLFVVVIAFLPNGIAGLVQMAKSTFRRVMDGRPGMASEPAVGAAPKEVV